MPRKVRTKNSSGWGWESATAKVRRFGSNPQRLVVTQRIDMSDVAMPDLEAPYKSSHNLALLLEALRHCAVADTCPPWVASSIDHWLRSERFGRGPIGQWWRQHEKDLIDLQRSWAVDEGRRLGLSRAKAGEYASERLSGTLGAAQPSQLLEVHKRVLRRQKGNAGRYTLTGLDRAWFAEHFPHTPAAAARHSTLAKKYAQSLGRQRGKKASNT